MKSLLILVLLIFSMGAGSLTIAVSLVMDSQNFLAHAITAPGTITGFVEIEGRTTSSKPSYVPIIEFKTLQGQTIVFTSNVGTASNRFATVTVFYNPDQPAGARLDSFFGFWGVAIIAGLIGFIFLLVGCFTLAYYRRCRHLFRHGYKIDAYLETVKQRPGARRGSSYVAIFKGFDQFTSKSRFFESESLQFDPRPLLQDKHSKTLVYIDPQNSKNYYVDTAWLRKLKPKK